MGCGASSSANVEHPPAREVVDPGPGAPVHQRGVTLAWLLKWGFTAAGDGELSVGDVVEQVVRPGTEPHGRCCLWEVVPPSCRGVPTYFVSHAWSRPMEELMGALALHFGVTSGTDPVARSTVVWLDIIAVSQWPQGGDEVEVMGEGVASVTDVVRATQQTLVVLDPVGAALSRIWCIFEVWQTVLSKGPKGLAVVAQHTDVRELAAAWVGLDAATAQASFTADHDHILSYMRTHGGHDAAGDVVKQALVEAVLLDALPAPAALAVLGRVVARRVPGSALMPHSLEVMSAADKGSGRTPSRHSKGKAGVEEAAGRLSVAADLLRLHDQPQDALELHQAALEMYCRVLPGGAVHEMSLAAAGEVAADWFALGRAGNALAMYEKLYALCKSQLGPLHPSTLHTLASCASAARRTGDGARALSVAQALLDARTAAVSAAWARKDADDAAALEADVATSQLQVGQALREVGRPADALAMVSQAVDTRLAALGPRHPDTLRVLMSRAITLQELGRSQEAADCLGAQVLDVVREVMGPDHPMVADTLTNLAAALGSLGRADEAVRLHAEALQVFSRAHGPAHPDAILASYNMGVELMNLGRAQEAVDVLQAAHDAWVSVLGPQHPDVADASTALALARQQLAAGPGSPLPAGARVAVTPHMHEARRSESNAKVRRGSVGGGSCVQGLRDALSPKRERTGSTGGAGSTSGTVGGAAMASLERMGESGVGAVVAAGMVAGILARQSSGGAALHSPPSHIVTKADSTFKGGGHGDDQVRLSPNKLQPASPPPVTYSSPIVAASTTMSGAAPAAEGVLLLDGRSSRGSRGSRASGGGSSNGRRLVAGQGHGSAAVPLVADLPGSVGF